MSQKNNQLLHLFVRDNQSELADFILDYPEVKVGQGFDTALPYAVHHGRNEMTCLLIDARWDNIVRAPDWVRNNPDINSSYRQGRIQIATAINQDIEDAQQQILLMGGDDIFLQQLYQRHFMFPDIYSHRKAGSRNVLPAKLYKF